MEVWDEKKIGRLVTSDFLVFRVAFRSLISFWIASISVVRVVMMVCFSAIWDTISDLGRFLLPFVLGIFVILLTALDKHLFFALIDKQMDIRRMVQNLDRSLSDMYSIISEIQRYSTFVCSLLL